MKRIFSFFLSFIALFSCSFVFSSENALAPLKKEYYSHCHSDSQELIVIQDNEEEQSSFLMPEYVRVKGECYQRVEFEHPKDAVLVNNWEESDQCLRECSQRTEPEDPKINNWEKSDQCLAGCQKTDTCFSHFLTPGLVDDEQAITYMDSKGKKYQAKEVLTVFLNGVEIEDCRTKVIINEVTGEVFTSTCWSIDGLQAFDEHFSWIKTVGYNGIFTFELYYDGELYDTSLPGGSISHVRLYKDGVYYYKSSDQGENHFFYNKEDYGLVEDVKENRYTLKFPDVIFDSPRRSYYSHRYDLPGAPPYPKDRPIHSELIPDREKIREQLVEAEKRRCMKKEYPTECLKDAERLACGVFDPYDDNDSKEQYCSGTLLKWDSDFVGYVNNEQLWATYMEGKRYPLEVLKPYNVPQRETKRAFSFKNEIIPFDDQDQLPDSFAMGLHLEDVVGEDFALHFGSGYYRSVYWNGIKRYSCEDGCQVAQVFKEHLAIINNQQEVIYDGKVLGKIFQDDLILYEDHVGFALSEEDPRYSIEGRGLTMNQYIDGNIYSTFSSMLTNLTTCREAYKESFQ